MNDIKSIKKIMLLLAIPLVFYLLKELKFIFIPLTASFFLALLFMPFLRWLQSKKIPQFINITIVCLLLIGGIIAFFWVVKLSMNEIIYADDAFYDNFEKKISALVNPFSDFLGIEVPEDGKIGLGEFVKNKEISHALFGNLNSTLNFFRKTLIMALMTLFFLVLLLSGSINVQQIMENTIFKQRFASIKTFLDIEKSIVTFMKVKFVMSFFTGLGFGLACYAFGVSFPFFWGLFAFLINFVQMIGSVISTVLLTVFAMVELQSGGSLLFFSLVLTFVQVLLGGILEPIFMGKSFSINTIAVLVMLMLWGYIWGIPGLILSIPITVFLKKVMMQFRKTKIIADILS